MQVIQHLVDAVMAEDMNLLEVMLAAGLIPLNGRTADKDPLVWLAIRNDRRQAADWLVNAGASVNEAVPDRDPKFASRYVSLVNPVQLAARLGDWNLVGWLLDRGATMSVDDLHALRNHVVPHDFVLRLVRNGFDVNALTSNGHPVLSGGCSLAFARAVLAAGLDPNLESTAGLTPLFSASNADVVRVLAVAGGDVRRVVGGFGCALHAASAAGLEGVVGELVVRGADVNAVNGGGLTPLMVGVGVLPAGGVRVLLRAGASLVARDVNGRCALAFAVEAACFADGSRPGARSDLAFEHVRELVLAGADVNAVDAGGVSVLMLAVRYGAGRPTQVRRVVEFLIGAGADVNAVSSMGVTALHLAVERDDAATVALLLAAGADALVSVPGGRSAVELIVRKRSRELLAACVTGGVPVGRAVDSRGRSLGALAREVGFEPVFREVLGS